MFSLPLVAVSSRPMWYVLTRVEPGQWMRTIKQKRKRGRAHTLLRRSCWTDVWSLNLQIWLECVWLACLKDIHCFIHRHLYYRWIPFSSFSLSMLTSQPRRLFKPRNLVHVGYLDSQMIPLSASNMYSQTILKILQLWYLVTLTQCIKLLI